MTVPLYYYFIKVHFVGVVERDASGPKRALCHQGACQKTQAGLFSECLRAVERSPIDERGVPDTDLLQRLPDLTGPTLSNLQALHGMIQRTCQSVSRSSTQTQNGMLTTVEIPARLHTLSVPVKHLLAVRNVCTLRQFTDR